MGARLNPGQVLEGKYTILRQIGSGGMGVVYEAEHIELNVRVAIKVLHPTESDDPTMLARFKSEARSAAGIRHRNVVDVTDFGLTPDRRPFFVMEYLTGESLADRLDSLGSLSEREAVEISDQILCGLTAAHRKGIVHRDLKPENVWLSRDETGTEVVKILDFGIAKIVGGVASGNIPTLAFDDRPQTQRGIVLGTPGYMAPESLTFGGKADERSDLFAVGVLLYEMIVGRRPFNGVTVHEIMMATATAPVPQPRALQPGVSAAMERLILTSLAKDPDDRFQSAEEFLRHLTAAAVGRVPDHARPCVTAVGLPSVMPAAALKRVRHAVPDNEPSRARRPDAPDYQSPFSEPWSGRRREVALAPPRAKKKRNKLFRVNSPISPAGIVVLVVIAMAFYFLYVRNGLRQVAHDEVSRIPGASAPFPAEPVGERASPYARPSRHDSLRETVTFSLDLDPEDAHVTVNGAPISDRSVVVPRGTEPVRLRATAPGKAPLAVDVVPDQDRSVELHLETTSRGR